MWERALTSGNLLVNRRTLIALNSLSWLSLSKIRRGYYTAVGRYEFYLRVVKIKFISSNRRVMFFFSCKQYKNPVSNIHFWSIITDNAKNLLYFNELHHIIWTQRIPVHHFSVFLSYVHFCDNWNMLFFSFNNDENWFATLTKVAILKTKLLAGNDHVKTASSIYIWSKNFSHSAYVKSEAKDGGHWRPKSMKILNSFHSIFPPNTTFF